MSSAKKKDGANKKVAKESILRKYRQFVRIRPLMDNEKSENQKKDNITNARSAVEYQDEEIYLMDPKGLSTPKPMIKPTIKKKYKGVADEVFWSFGEDPWVTERRDKTPLEADDYDHVYADNDDVYETVKSDTVQMLYDGYNQTVCTYGPTNGGKTHTLFGSDKSPGIAPRLLKDLVAVLPTQTEERQAPGETLEIAIDVQCFRIYKEEIEDLNHGYPRPPLKGDGAKIGVGELETATKIRIANESDLKAFNERVWAGKDAIRKTSNITTPNKHNRSTVVVVTTITQTSKFQEGDQTTESSKSSILTLADVGHGLKADNETPVDFKKISLAQTTFQQVIRKLGEKGAEWAAAEEADRKAGGSGKVVVMGKTHIPFNTSIMTRMLAEALGESHVTLICCISPYHKHHSDTQSWLELCEFGYKARAKATPNEGKDLQEFREKLEEKDKMQKEMAHQSAAVVRVKEELEGRQVKINTLKREIAEGQEDIDRFENDIAYIKEKIAEISHRLQEQRKSSRNYLAYLDRREHTALADKDAAEKKMAELRAFLKENAVKSDKQAAMIAQAGDLLKRAAGLNALLTGKPVKADNLFSADGGGEYNEGQNFEKDSSAATQKLQDAIAKYEKVVTMNDENNKLLEEIQHVLTEADKVEEEKNKTQGISTRYKRRCVRELMAAIEELVKGTAHTDGHLKQLNELTNKYTAHPDKAEAARFYLEECTGVSKVLGSALLGSPSAGEQLKPSQRETEEAPGWCKWKNIVPVRPWINSLSSKGERDPAASFGGTGTAGTNKDDADYRFRVEDVTNEEIQSMHELVMCNQAWCDKLLRYNATREAIESAYEEWFERMPKWPKSATDAAKILKAAKDQDLKVEGLRKDIADLNKEISQHEGELSKAQDNVKKLNKTKVDLQAELKKEQDKCVIL